MADDELTTARRNRMARAGMSDYRHRAGSPAAARDASRTEHRAALLSQRDAEYRRALGLPDDGHELPHELGHTHHSRVPSTTRGPWDQPFD